MWACLRAEIAVEFQALQPTMWDAWELHTPTRDENARKASNRAETKRRISVLHAMGKIREARKLESAVRAANRRRGWKR